LFKIRILLLNLKEGNFLGIMNKNKLGKREEGETRGDR
jgi:hypothetical protein